MLTKKQQKLLADPRLAEIISRLELEPIPSKEFRQAQAISARVDSWIDQIIASPSVPREITWEGKVEGCPF